MYLKKLELSGFKSFARATTLEFPHKITAIVGPNGSGKCVEGTTQVQLKSGEILAIKELFDKTKKSAKRIDQIDDGEVISENPFGFEVASLNPRTLKIEWRPVSKFIKRIANPMLLEIKTKTGRSVTTTPYHPLFTIKDGEFAALRADELRPGVRIAAPRTLPIKGKEISIDFSELISLFDKKDNIYLPYSEILNTFLRKEMGEKSIAAYARTGVISARTISNIFSMQAINLANFSSPLLNLPSDLFASRMLKSRTTGFLKVPNNVDASLARFLGYLIAEGRNTAGAQAWFVNDDPAVVDDFVKCSKECFGLTAGVFSYKSCARDVIIFSKSLCTFLDKVFRIPVNSVSRDKVVPPQIFTSSNEVVAEFLSALIEGDGYFNLKTEPRTQMYFEYATASRELAFGVSSLLLRLGIVAIVREKQKYASNTEAKTKRTYYSVYVYGNAQLRALISKLHLVGRKKETARRIMQIVQQGNPNIDLIPGILPHVRELIRETGVKVKTLRKSYPRLAAYNEKRCEPSHEGILEVIRVVQKHGKLTPKAERLINYLKTVATSDVFWDEVVSVTEKKGEEWVYDLTISETHNFVANNIVAHNSNIAEGVRWVLGEQSMKALRSKKGEELIWNGSPASPTGRPQVPRTGKASVTLIFDNKDGKIPLDFEEVSIGRKIFRDGLNEYYLNDSQVRLKDVVELIARIGLGESKHNIIGQGEVDRILLSSSRDRREMLEEALGLRVYQLKKHEAELKLDSTEENMKQVEALIREIAPHLKFLSLQARKAETRGGVEEQLRLFQKIYFSKEKKEIDKEKRGLEERSGPFKKRREGVKKEMELLEGSIARLENSFAALGVKNEAEEQRKRLEVRRRELERELGRLEGKLELERERASQPKFRMVDMRYVKDEIQTVLEEIRSIIEEEDRIDVVRSHMQVLIEDLEHLLDEIGRGTIEEKRGEEEAPLLKELEKTVGGIQKKLREIAGELEKFEQSAERERENYRTLQLEIRGEDSALRAYQNEERDLALELERIRFEEERWALRVRSFAEGLRELGLKEEELGAALLDGYEEMPQEELKRKIERFRARLEEIGGIDVSVVKEYQETEARHSFLSKELTDLKQASGSLRELIKELEGHIKNDFKEGFSKIKEEFHNYFRIIFGGGSAKLQIINYRSQKLFDEDVPEDGKEESEEGVEINVDLPRKRIRGLAMLSGGEKALTSIALLFAITAVNPPPFLILDETDAALDEANSQRYAAILRELSKKTQLILVTHNRETMKVAGVLYGVTMGDDGVSKLLSLKLEEAEVYTSR